jgi:hypothetical protein
MSDGNEEERRGDKRRGKKRDKWGIIEERVEVAKNEEMRDKRRKVIKEYNEVTHEEQSITSVEAIRIVRRCIALRSSSSTTSFHSSVFKRNLKSETASDDTHRADWE